MISSLLGRLPAVSIPNTSGDGEVVARLQHPLDSRAVAFEAAFRASRIIGEITMKISGGTRLSVAETEGYLRRLTAWRTSLPDDLRQIVGSHASGEDALNSGDHGAGHVIASMNVACSYYHAVILLTRPFLIATHQASRKLDTEGGSSQTEKNTLTALQEDYQRLASVSVDAAVYMVETICHAKQTGSLLPNTCFTKSVVLPPAS